MRVQAEERAGHLRAARAHEPGQPDDLAGSDVKPDVSKSRTTGEALHLQHHLAQTLRGPRRIDAVESPAHHEPDDRVDVELARGPRLDKSTVAQDRDLVSDPEDLVHPM